MQDRKNLVPLQLVWVVMMMVMMVIMMMMMMMNKYDINLTMPPGANTLHAASQEHTQIVTAIV